jgi:hypothetical protein
MMNKLLKPSAMFMVPALPCGYARERFFTARSLRSLKTVEFAKRNDVFFSGERPEKKKLHSVMT